MKRILVYLTIGVFLFNSCQKDDYFQDTGVHETTYNGTVLKYLKDHPNNFKKLVEIIEYAGLQDVFEKQDITFFAPQDVSINKTILSINSQLYRQARDTIKTVADVTPEVWEKYLGLYVINNKYELKDIAQIDTVSFRFEGQSFVSRNGRIMNAGVMYHDAGGVPYAGYRMVLYAYIGDFADARGSRINVPISSSNIKPSNGVVHVLRAKNHAFGFAIDKFYDSVINGGLTNTN